MAILDPVTTRHVSEPAGDISSRVRSAQALVRSGDLSGAEHAFRAVLSEQPDVFAAASGLVKLLNGQQRAAEAQDVLRAAVHAAPTHSNILTASRFWQEWAAGNRTSKSITIAMTGDGTLTALAAHLQVSAAQAGLQPRMFVGEFGQWGQELLDPGSALYQSQPDVVVVRIDSDVLFPLAARSFRPDDAALEAERAAGIRQIAEVLQAAGTHAPQATIILHSFAAPNRSPLGVLDLRQENGQMARFAAINLDLAAMVRAQYPAVVLFDQERVEARFGKDRIRDDRMWYMASAPFSDAFLPTLAAEYLRILRPLKGLTRKCIVLDLDNTLWGGVIGEDGINQIKLGGTAAPGNAFLDFQRALLALQERGILLAVCSKNNPEDVWPVLDEHPYMVLRRNAFAAMRINWQDKATNIADIARELNIGLDSLVFFDDNPAERGLVQQQLPDVLTVDLPQDVSGYVRTLANLDVFETLSVTAEDQKRGELYAQQQERKQFEQTATSTGDLKAYLHGLQITASIASATAFTLPRIAQLINKTNQFNVTTRRYTEAQVAAMAADSAGWGVYSISVGDRFGDSGLTGVAIVKKAADAWTIDSFLLSCRVLGRGIESALITYIARLAADAGATLLRGEFIPTPKNAPATEFFRKEGFQPGSTSGDGATMWLLDVAAEAPNRTYPEWINLSFG